MCSKNSNLITVSPKTHTPEITSFNMGTCCVITYIIRDIFLKSLSASKSVVGRVIPY